MFQVFSKYSIKFQILLSYSIILVITAGLTLLICYLLLFDAGKKSYSSAHDTIISNANSNCFTFAQEVSGMALLMVSILLPIS